MTSKELRTYLKAWIQQVLNTEQGLSIPVITSNQNAPAPSGMYIVIQYMPARNPFGMATKGSTQDDGTRILVDDQELTITLKEVNGEGDLLVELIKSLEREDILNTYFRIYGIAYQRSEEITSVPRLDVQEWVRECMVEILLGVGECINETTSYIETVEYNSNIGSV